MGRWWRMEGGRRREVGGGRNRAWGEGGSRCNHIAALLLVVRGRLGTLGCLACYAVSTQRLSWATQQCGHPQLQASHTLERWVCGPLASRSGHVSRRLGRARRPGVRTKREDCTLFTLARRPATRSVFPISLPTDLECNRDAGASPRRAAQGRGSRSTHRPWLGYRPRATGKSQRTTCTRVPLKRPSRALPMVRPSRAGI